MDRLDGTRPAADAGWSPRTFRFCSRHHLSDPEKLLQCATVFAGQVRRLTRETCEALSQCAFGDIPSTNQTTDLLDQGLRPLGRQPETEAEQSRHC